ncbi:IS3 family transposase [Streptomyces antibioticus]|uniref:IS3 family transposase n=1 Tax=Streptomyces antibioticus TaxID=1890 RepID=UPI003F4B0563
MHRSALKSCPLPRRPQHESFFGALKNERVSRVTYLTREAARQDITRYIEFRYNRKRLHSAVCYHPPREVHAEYEKLRIAA